MQTVFCTALWEGDMRKVERDPESLLPLPLSVFHILLSLSDAERHGYGIMKEVEARTEGKVRLGPGILYGNIKQMIQDGLIERSNARPDPDLDDERRIYYRLTNLGQRVAGAETKRLSQLIGMARSKKVLSSSKLRPNTR
jgi:DNA-binding PadR family transcriptional regulator